MTPDTIANLLVMIAPALTAMATIIGGIVGLAKWVKKSLSTTKEDLRKENLQLKRDIAIIKSKLTSIEHILSEREDH